MHGRIAVRRSRAAGWSRSLGALAVPVFALDALGAKVGWVPREAIIPALLLSFVLAIAAWIVAAYALTDIWKSGALGAGSAAAGLLYASPVVAILGVIAALAIIYPRLNDVSTDLEDPPSFTGAAAPSAEAADDERAAMQVDAYPDLQAHLYDASIEAVYAAARGLVDERGWTVVRDIAPPSMAKQTASGSNGNEGSADTAGLDQKSVMTQSRGEATGRNSTEDQGDNQAPNGEASTPSQTSIIEAVARTPILGFRDHIVLRIQSGTDGITVDMRSASEIGSHDLGENARRIRSFLEDLDVALAPPPNPNAPAGGAATVSIGGAQPP
jgi:hypothetical protein